MNPEAGPTHIPYVPDNAPFSKEQRAWLNGFLVGRFGSSAVGESSAVTITKTSLAILYGSQTGTAEQLAKKMAAEAGQRLFEPRVLEMNSYTTIDLKQEKRLLLLTSTWGDGDPPDNAAAFWNYLNSDEAPRLDHMQYSVLALGDRNYANFCAAGRKFDARLEQLGAKRVYPCVECDTDYETPARNWMNAVWAVLKTEADGGASIKEEISTTVAAAPKPEVYSTNNRFSARLLVNRKLNGARSAKDTRHFEISLGDAGLTYEVGDALGMMPTNCPTLVDEMLTALHCDGEEAVKIGQGLETSFRKALLENFQITRISQALLTLVAEQSRDVTLAKLLEPANKAELDEFLFGREVIHLLQAYPGLPLAPGEFVAKLLKLQPRLYSISSSPRKHPGEVHLTVAIVRYQSHGRQCGGVCSTFLADRTKENTPVPVFVQTSHGFRLPANPDAPLIMIGPGTGASLRSGHSWRNARQLARRERTGCFLAINAARLIFFIRRNWKRAYRRGI